MENKKSLGVNFIFNLMRTLMGVVIPLVTFPYSSRVLGPEALGKVDYAQANLTYFILLQAFGIGGYAIREGARIRDDKKKMNEFASDMLTINLITASVAYVFFFGALALPKLRAYRGLMLMFSTGIILSAIGVEWLYNIYEDYQYITIRSFVFQILSVVLLFTCVKSEKDYMIYALSMVISSVGSNIMNFLRARKYVEFKVRISKRLRQHLKPMSYIFLLDVASSVYLVMDRSMLGYITGNDAEVGLYAAAIKIASVLTSFFTAIWTVMRSRVAYTLERDYEQAQKLIYLTGKIILFFSIPSAVGLCFLDKHILLLFAGNKYIGVGTTLQILLLNVIVATFNGFLINMVFIVYRKDKNASRAVILGAVVNLLFNIIAINLYGKTGAAVATVLSEVTILVYACICGRTFFKVQKMFVQICQSLAGCVPIVIVYMLCTKYEVSLVWTMLNTILIGGMLYLVFMRIIRNNIIMSAISYIKSKRIS